MNSVRTVFVRLSVIAAATLTIAAGTARAQSAYTPDKGAPERGEILEVMRVPAERAYKQKLVFVVDSIKVSGTWAFVSATPTTAAGKAPLLRGTRFEGYQDAYDNNFFGLARKSGGKWRVVTTAMGCTDVCYSDWWKRFKAPKAIFPYTE